MNYFQFGIQLLSEQVCNDKANTVNNEIIFN